MEKRQKRMTMELYDILEKLQIRYEEITHKAVYTVLEAEEVEKSIEGFGCKNLFLKDPKEKRYYLYILPDEKRADLKELSAKIGVKRLHFASEEELFSVLKLTTGSVTPFGLLFDKEKQTTVLFDADLPKGKLLFHPNTNTKTLSIAFEDLIRFLEHIEGNYRLLA
ncbi:MAG: prolyl-tRNA synthetase associated domain-containing protein [Christensenellaceae bacterium]|nr:prolyl-tRNA synthetase associated domain-containing protein [Christensenellaceae bacterium]